jgi:inner membrane protein
MPSLLSHPAVPLALGLALGARVIPPRLLLAGVAASVLPDLDVLAFRLGLPYAHDFGHRGASHSLAFAALLGLIAAALAPRMHASRRAAGLFVMAAAASHGLLDMLTNGGMGVAWAWPLSSERDFFPLQVIQASPLSLRRFFSAAGATVLMSELLWIWLPSAGLGALVLLARRHVTVSRPARLS